MIIRFNGTHPSDFHITQSSKVERLVIEATNIAV
jgi:hypothetical protein